MARRIALRGATTKAVIWSLFKLASLASFPGAGGDCPPITPGAVVEELDAAIKREEKTCQYRPKQFLASRRLLQNSLVKPDGGVVPDGKLAMEDVGLSMVVGRLEMKVEVSIEEMVAGEEVIVGNGAGVVEVVVGTGAGGMLLVVVIGTVVRVLGVVVTSLVVIVAGAEVGDTFGWGVNVSVWP